MHHTHRCPLDSVSNRVDRSVCWTSKEPLKSTEDDRVIPEVGYRVDSAYNSCLNMHGVCRFLGECIKNAVFATESKWFHTSLVVVVVVVVEWSGLALVEFVELQSG